MLRVIVILFFVSAAVAGEPGKAPDTLEQIAENTRLAHEEEARELERLHIERDASLKSTLPKEQMDVLTQFYVTRGTELKALLTEDQYRCLKDNSDLDELKIYRFTPSRYRLANGDPKPGGISEDNLYFQPPFGSCAAVVACKNDTWMLRFGTSGYGMTYVYLDAVTNKVLWIWNFPEG